jgi:hypothetical protein
MSDGAGSGDRIAIFMTFDSDSVARRYTGYTTLPNNARAPHHKTEVKDGALHWEQPNSGGGTWFYVARLVGQDSIAGTMVLRDWPQGGGATPSGTFSLVRLKPGQ